MRVLNAIGRFVRDGLAFVGTLVFIGAIVVAFGAATAKAPTSHAKPAHVGQATTLAAPVPLPRSARPSGKACWFVERPPCVLFR